MHCTRQIIHSALLLALAAMATSCENSIEVIRNMGKVEELPMVSASDMEIYYSDSAKLKMRITAPEVRRFDLPGKQYTLFPKGLSVEQYDTSYAVMALITANYAIHHHATNLWEARGNVIAKNIVKKEELNTEELFWDQEKGIIYSKKFSRITNADGVFYGDGGFEADQNMTNYRMIGIKGGFNIKENAHAQQNP